MSTHILPETVKGDRDSFGVLGINKIVLKWVLKEILWEGIGWIRVAENRLGCENHNRLSGYSKYGDIFEELSDQSVTKYLLFRRASW
jgi:hypothetical protein